jgi:hypothetical protein
VAGDQFSLLDGSLDTQPREAGQAVNVIDHHTVMAVCRDHGPAAMSVLMVLVAHRHHEDGTEISHRVIADETGFSTSTIKRALADLDLGGLIKIEPQHSGGRQGVNRYLIMPMVLGGQHDHGVQNDPTHGVQNELAESTTTTISNSQVVSSSIPLYTNNIDTSDDLPATAPADLRSAGKEDVALPGSQVDHGCIVWPSADSPMPLGNPRRCLLDRWNQAFWLVSFFERPVLERMIRRSLASNRKPPASVSETRKLTWLTNAVDLLGTADLDEVCEVISWTFDTFDGYMPFEVEGPLGVSRPRDAKLTNLRVVEENWDQLVTMWRNRTDGTSRESDGSTFERSHDTTPPSRVKYTQTQIDELVDLFDQFQRGQSDEFRRANWAKTFAIMLGHDGIEFPELREVIGGLSIIEDFIDTSKYHDAFNVREHYDFLKKTIPAIVAIQRNRSHQGQREDNDETPVRTVQGLRRPDTAASSDMTNIEARQERYRRTATLMRDDSSGREGFWDTTQERPNAALLAAAGSGDESPPPDPLIIQGRLLVGDHHTRVHDPAAHRDHERLGAPAAQSGPSEEGHHG